MKQPLWLLNLSLIAMFGGAIVLSLLLAPTPVKQASIKPRVEQPAEEEEEPKVSIARIYENDLFGTYIPQPQPEVKKPKLPDQPPQPPQPQPAPPAPQPEPSFLAPLEVILKGIIFTNDESQTRAIIADTKTQEENIYQVGDAVKDADIVHIGKDKVMLIRSNGQQETLFITEQSAQKDPGHPTHTHEWSNIIQQQDESTYSINVHAFTDAVPHLSYLLDELDVTTAFENGKVVGVHVGKIDAKGLGAALGLASGDIVTHINGTPTNTTQNRVNIYHDILQKQAGDTITVDVRRKGTTTTIRYTLQQRSQALPKQTPATLPSDNPIRKHQTTNKSVMANGNQQKQLVDALQKPMSDNALRRGGENNALRRNNNTPQEMKQR